MMKIVILSISNHRSSTVILTSVIFNPLLLTATKTSLVICVGVFGTLILFLILNLSSSLFEQNHNSNDIAAIIDVGNSSNIGEKGGEGWKGSSSSFYSLFSIFSPQYAYAKEHI